MKLKTIYLIFCLLGLVLPYWQLTPWVAENSLNMRIFFQQLFANRVSAFFGIDVLVSAAVLLVFMRSEASRVGVQKRWIPVLALLTVGVSLALPLFLYMREVTMQTKAAKG